MGKTYKWIIITMIIIFIFCFFCGFFASSTETALQLLKNNQTTISVSIENKEEDEKKENKKVTNKIKEKYIFVYTNTTANIRQEPSLEGKILKTISINTKLKQVSNKNGWIKIKISENNYGYIKSNLISKNKTKIKKKTVKKEKVNKSNNKSKKKTKKVTTRDKKVIIKGSKSLYKKYAYEQVLKRGWTVNDYNCLVKLWNRESGWNPRARNRSSGAYGIPQALPASKMASCGKDYLTNYKTQIKWGLKYIKGRYGSPSRAWSFFQKHNWY